MAIRLTPTAGLTVAMVAAALAPLSLAPFNLWPLGIISLVLLLACLEGASSKQAFWRGWLYGIGFYGVGASWVYYSIHEYGYAPAPLALFLTVLFVAGLALLLCASFGVLYVKALPQNRLRPLLGFPALWVLFEWLRSWLLTGFPWLYLGYAHLDTWLSGWAPVIGVYGIGLILSASAGLIFEVLRRRPLLRGKNAVAVAVLLLPWLPALPLQSISWVQPQEQDSRLQVTLVQPNISQHLKWRSEQRNKTLALLREISEQHLDSDLVVWPENAVPLFLHQAGEFLSDMETLGRRSQTAFITGIPHWQQAQDSEPQQLHNSVIALGMGAQGLYHKQKLVPFGEYVPFQRLLRGLIRFFDLPMSDFAPGTADQSPLALHQSQRQINIAPYICYEIVYPDFVRKAATRSDLLLTISDDSWFGSSIGPLQHLQMARMRALENGRYLVRSTNTGMTAIIDNRGKVIAQAEQFQQTSLTGEVTLLHGVTPYGRWGSIPVILLCLMLAAAARFAPGRIDNSGYTR